MGRIEEICARCDAGRPVHITDVKWLLAAIERKNFIILGIMHSVDKWLDGDELNRDEINRAAVMREKTLHLVEDLTARAEKAEEERDTYKAALQNWHEQEGTEL